MTKFAWPPTIAGSYTPVCLIALPGDKGIHLLTMVWAVAAGSFCHYMMAYTALCGMA